jgi:hypothetical protein
MCKPKKVAGTGSVAPETEAGADGALVLCAAVRPSRHSNKSKAVQLRIFFPQASWWSAPGELYKFLATTSWMMLVERAKSVHQLDARLRRLQVIHGVWEQVRLLGRAHADYTSAR